MKKSTVMLWAIFGVLLMSCSEEEIANVETSSRNAIGFNVLSNAAETRATPTTNTNLKNSMDEYGSGTTHANYDVMYAMAKGQTKDMNNGIVKFNFKHILSQVVFKAKTQYDNMQVDIDVIKIHNFKFAGAFTLPAAADGTGSWSSSDLAFPHAFTVVKNANITVNSNTEATDITTNTPMLNIPQELTAWKVSETATKSKLEADNAKQCYLEIACKIRQSGAYLLGSASEYKTIYVPFGDTWEQGKRHIYTLIFGGGYDDQGEAVLNPIQFDAETTGWVDADKDVNVQP